VTKKYLQLKKKMSRAKPASDIFILPEKAKQKLPSFAIRIADMLSEKFPETYIVGGAVRNLILQHKIGDVDIATKATPDHVVQILKKNKISYSAEHKQFGVVIAKSGAQLIEITTFRADIYGKSRFPKVSFVHSARRDSYRRDFTINALYYCLADNSVHDFHDGLTDVLDKKIRFIGNTKKRILEDPLRIIRAYKFALQYNLYIDKKTEKILQNNISLLKNVNSKRINKEINSVAAKKLQLQLQKVIHSNS
jgi:tRNA nucleotidyltransferase/poly(A) polymerase